LNVSDNLHIFSEEIKSSFLLHVPHSSITIPYYDEFLNEKNVIDEQIILTDWCTDAIFDVYNIDKLRCPFSRVFCDVERFSDETEVMEKYGKGFVYTLTDDNKELRIANCDKDYIKNNFYDSYHNKFNKIITDKIEKYGYAYIFDCHSFPNIPLLKDLHKDKNRPDICIGTNPNTPKYLITFVSNYFLSYGYSVSINNPYSGSIVPIQYINDNRVKSIMIELNRDLYMEGKYIDTSKLIQLNKLINNLFNF